MTLSRDPSVMAEAPRRSTRLPTAPRSSLEDWVRSRSLRGLRFDLSPRTPTGMVGSRATTGAGAGAGAGAGTGATGLATRVGDGDEEQESDSCPMPCRDDTARAEMENWNGCACAAALVAVAPSAAEAATGFVRPGVPCCRRTAMGDGDRARGALLAVDR